MVTEIYAAVERIQSYAVESLNRYEKIVAAEPNNPPPSLFAKLFHASADETLSKDELVGDAGAYIIAGSDTTSNTMTYLTWEMCRNPSMKARLVEELASLPEGYRDEDLKTLPYMNQVIMETLRCYAAAPSLLPREVPATGCEIDGYFMPPGTIVQTQAYSMHRNAEIYPDPERQVQVEMGGSIYGF
jgi:cytochrome P450